MHQQDTISNTTERSKIALLRGLVPQRRLTAHEAYRIAELQANRLLELFDVQTAAVPEEIISELPRIRIARERGLPMSGSAHWNGRHWVITVSADEHPFRQRFSLMHEFKHVLDHTTRHFLYGDTPYRTATEQAERVADTFAAFVLMPKRVIKRMWCSGHQNIEQLAWMLQVSPQALRYRLDQLGLTDRPSRCDRPRQASVAGPAFRHSYFRAAAPLVGASR